MPTSDHLKWRFFRVGLAAILGGLLFAAFTLLETWHEPVDMGTRILLSFPGALIKQYCGLDDTSPNGFFDTHAFYVLANAVLGALIFSFSACTWEFFLKEIFKDSYPT
jgi:hypothetical protein